MKTVARVIEPLPPDWCKVEAPKDETPEQVRALKGF